MPDFADLFLLSLCLWREARGEQRAGMIAVGCVVRNRVTRHRSSYYSEVVKPWQFSSITAKGDPELALYPAPTDPQWQECKSIAADIVSGKIQDTTGGATLYYANSIPFPASWNKSVITATVTVGNQFFFREN